MQALLDRLKSVDPKARQAELEAALKTETRPREIDKLVKELKIIRNLNSLDLSPYDAFTKKVLPVIPSAFRAPITLPGGSLYNPDINVLTRNVGLVNDVLSEAKGKVDPETLESLKKDLYDQVGQLTAIEAPEAGYDELRKNYFTTIAGVNTPKGGFFQSKMIRKRQNLSARGVIIPNSTLGIDEAEIPFNVGFKIYEPFIRRAMKERGYKSDEIDSAISGQTDLAKRVLQDVGNTRPVILNRAPSIWGGSVTGHRPIFVDKETIGVPNLFDTYAKGDHDGDSCLCDIHLRHNFVNKTMRRSRIALTIRGIALVFLCASKTKLKRSIASAIGLLRGHGSVFIGDIIHYPRPYEEKRNEWGGMNSKYRVLPGQHVRALDTTTSPPSVVWDEIVSLSKHRNIPEMIVTLADGYSITCSPGNSIVIYDNGAYTTVDLLRRDVTGEVVPCIDKDSGCVYHQKIVSVEYCHRVIDMWDVTLKNNTIFLADNHLFVFDTVAVHVPVTQGAIKDVLNMRPSMTLIAEQSGSLVAEPEHSAIVGLYNLSKTPQGRKRINDILPDTYDFKGPVSKSDILAMLQQIALDKGPDAGKVINDIRRLGDSVAHDTGLTISLSDLKPLKEARDIMMPSLLKELRSLPEKERTQENLGNIYTKYIKQGNQALDDYYKGAGTELADIYLSKARGSQSQYRDMVLSPIAVVSRDMPSRPIRHSYVEGLSPAEYAIAAHGARLGVLGRSQGAAMPGALGKELLATANTLVINKAKGSSMGEIMAEVGKWRDTDIADRYLSRDVVSPAGVILSRKDELITPKLLQRIKSSGVKELWVYSPLQSSSADGGIPAMSYGNNHKGVLPTPGENIGATSAFALVEPLFTSSMGSFHTGGSLGGKASAYPRIKQILELTKHMPDKVPLAESTGTVSAISKDSLGGSEIIIDGNPHYVQPNLPLRVKVGDRVMRGDPLASGTIDPRDLADLKDLSAAQNYMVDELHSLIPSAKRRALETVVEGITRHAQVTDPGDSSYLPGDIDLISTIEKQNKDLVNKVKYDFLFKGVNYLPQNTQSWLSKLNFRNIKREFTQDVMSGAEADTSSYEPAPALARGLEFGKGKDGRY